MHIEVVRIPVHIQIVGCLYVSVVVGIDAARLDYSKLVVACGAINGGTIALDRTGIDDGAMMQFVAGTPTAASVTCDIELTTYVQSAVLQHGEATYA